MSYVQDKNAREWTFNYYTRTASYSLEFLSEYWPDHMSAYVKGTRNATERWAYCQSLLDEAVLGFERHLEDRKKAREARKRKDSVKAAASERRLKSRATTIKPTSPRE